MKALDLVNLARLLERTSGRPDVIGGLIDGPVAMRNPDLWSSSVRYVNADVAARCVPSGSEACNYGTLVAGILSSKRGSRAPAICPDCIWLVRPIFPEFVPGGEQWLGASDQELANAIVDAVKAGARVPNLSVGLLAPFSDGERQLCEALNYVAGAGVIAVAAAGNQGLVASSVLTRHPWAIPVIACDESGRPLAISDLGDSMGTHGLRPSGENVTSYGCDGTMGTLTGTSAAAPFVRGTAALLWSLFPDATATTINMASMTFQPRRSSTLVLLLLDAWAADGSLAAR